MIDSRVGAYHILAETGRGGMSTVYRAVHEAMDRTVAVKVMDRFTGDKETAAKRFQREMRFVARLEHPHILPIYDFDGNHDPPYIVMRLIGGGTLKEILNRGKTARETMLRLFGQVCSALDYAHRRGVIHRDIKPSNILIDDDGNAFLADFGLARSIMADSGDVPLTMPGVVLGTPGYMAPEQIMGSGTLDARVDVYAMGVVLYEIITGEPPFRGKDPISVSMAHVNKPVPRATLKDPSLPGSIDMVVATAMTKAPKDRYSSIADFSRAVEEALRSYEASGYKETREAFTETAVFYPAEEDKTQSEREVEPEPSRAEGSSRSDSSRVQHSKQVSILSASIAEFSENLKAAETQSSLKVLINVRERLNEIIGGYGGRVEMWTTDSVVATWGAEIAREDDPERAVSAALQMRTVLIPFLDNPDPEDVPIRLGISTGAALLTPRAGAGRLDVSGPTINLARNVERMSPPGHLLICGNTGRNVRKTFELLKGPPIEIPGPKNQIDTYLVVETKDLEKGIEDSSAGMERGRTVLRRSELGRLKDAMLSALKGKTRVVTVVGDRGLGKTRLMAEFHGWLKEFSPQGLRVISSRAKPGMERDPWSQLKELFIHIFEIKAIEKEGAQAAAIRMRLVEMMEFSHPGALEESISFVEGVLGVNQAGEGEGTQGLMERSREKGSVSRKMGDLFTRLCRKGPVIIQIADLHWADQESLESLMRFVQSCPNLPLLFVCLTRPGLYERTSIWGESPPFHQRIDLKPLTDEESRLLVRQALSEHVEIPDTLVEAIVSRAEGNPYFIEELVQVLLEDGIITKEGGKWVVQQEKIQSLQIPSTLTSLVQTRIDTLQPLERLVLQRAAVVGRNFWKSAVISLGSVEEEPDAELSFKVLIEKGFIYEKDFSTMRDVSEFAFRSTILREVLLESIPETLRENYNEMAAEWLSASSGDGVGWLGLRIGEHLERAGNPGKAAPYFMNEGGRAMKVGAYEDARSFFDRSLALLGKTKGYADLRLRLLLDTGQCLRLLGRYPEALEYLSSAMEMAVEAGESEARAESLRAMAMVLISQQVLDVAKAYLEECLEITAVENHPARAEALFGLGEIAWLERDYEEARDKLSEGLMIAREASERPTEEKCLIKLGSVAAKTGDTDSAKRYLRACEEIALNLGDGNALSLVFNGLGEVLQQENKLSEARAAFQESLALARATGMHEGIVMSLINLGSITTEMGELSDSAEHLKEALWEAWSANEWTLVMKSLLGFAALKMIAGSKDKALELTEIVISHAFSLPETVETAGEMLLSLTGGERVSPGIAQGDASGMVVLDRIVNELLGS